MPMDGITIERQIGEHQYKTLKYTSEVELRQKTNRLSQYNNNSIPTKLGGLTMLFCMSILSDIYQASNSSCTLSHGKTALNIRHRSSHCRGKINFITSPTYNDTSNSQNSACYRQNMIHPKWVFQSIPQTWMGRFSFPGALAHLTHTTTPRSSDDVTAIKIDYTCVEERAHPSIADILYKLADTLESPLTEMYRETTVLIHYLRNIPCPNKNERAELNAVINGLDEMINIIISKYHPLNIISHLKKEISGLLRFTAKLINSKKIIIENLEKTTSSLISFFRMIIYYTPQEIGESAIISNFTIPKIFLQKNDIIYININNMTWSLVADNGKYYAMRNGVYQSVTYDYHCTSWIFVDDVDTSSPPHFHDQFYTRCTVPSTSNTHKIFCRVETEAIPDNTEDHHPNAGEVNVENSHNEGIEAILARFDTGLNKNDANVEKLTFPSRWVVYRIRVVERDLQRFFHAIEINGRLIPARARKISLNRVHCEIYNRKQNEKSYPVEFNHGQWRVESSNSLHISNQLMSVITPDLFERNITSELLSTPDLHGIKVNAHGDEFIKLNAGFIKLNKDNYGYFLTTSDHTRLNLIYRFELFQFINAQRENRTLTLTPQQYISNEDVMINSDAGLDKTINLKLNENWILVSTNLKSSTLKENNTIGSKIDVTFHFQYNKSLSARFKDLPELVWKSESKLKDDNQFNHVKMDMTKQKKFDALFNAWNSRYVAAYHYTMSFDKNPKNSQVRICDNQGNPLYHTDFPSPSSAQEMANIIKYYLQSVGGMLDITISTYPHVKIPATPISLERVIKFDIGFPGIKLLKVNQGIAIEKNIPKHVFVSSSDQISLAEET